MAYMNQEKKKEIAKALKKVVPANWKYSLRVRNHSTIVMTIAKGPVELIADCEYDYRDLNHYCPENVLSGKTLETMKAIIEVLNTGNWDKSDHMTDYFDVGHYVSIQVGRWDKPFEVIDEKVVA